MVSYLTFQVCGHEGWILAVGLAMEDEEESAEFGPAVAYSQSLVPWPYPSLLSQKL